MQAALMTVCGQYPTSSFSSFQEFVPQCLLGVLHRGELADPEVVRYARQTAAALDYLHSQDVIHCDLAARNISSATFCFPLDCSLRA